MQNITTSEAGGVALVVECLPGKYEALNPNSSTAKTYKKHYNIFCHEN
jgi:hypothetical protein